MTGVVLMSAMVVAPAAAARQWSDRLGVMVGLAGFFGALAGVVGTTISSLGRGLSTGPVVVLAISGIVLLSLLLAPNRGLVWNWLRRQREHHQLQLRTVLTNLYLLAQQHDDPHHAHETAVLQAMSFQRGGVRHSLTALADLGWVQPVDESRWYITPTGITEAQNLFADKAGDA